ncbi:N4-gp56 family major capsid protein [Xanthobacter sp. DSM 24535]|uniref:N4-gp56 family major capsid protein n=1 Tax=Roseixanthobacter psychrophilus TaxID=3119917 RepID=UPI0037261F90
MSTTIINWGDAQAQKAWSGTLAVAMQRKSYFERKFIGTDENSLIQRKTELDSGAGDRVSFDLSVQLRGKPTTGDNRLDGNSENLRFYTDEVIIDQTRKSASAGGRMSRKRTAHDLRKVARDRLSDYWSQYFDEFFFIYLSGARGVNADFIEDQDWTGHAGNAIQAPDAGHILFGGAATSKATITSADKMSRDLIERASVNARMMRALDPRRANMMPLNVEGEQRYVVLMSTFQEHDLRTSDASGWLDIQKAAAASEGRNSPIMKGGLGMINNVVLHSHESAIRFSDAGAGANLPAARALFLGRQAAVVAYGTSAGLRFEWKEEMQDFGNEPIVASGTVIGVKKTRFNGYDFGVQTLDTYANNPNSNT